MSHKRILAAGIASLFALPALAVDRNWTGGGAPGVWNDAANWDTGIPTTGTADNIFIKLTGNLTGDAITANQLFLGTGTPGAPTSGFTFGAGAYTINYIAVADAFSGTNPTSNRFGRAFINAGTTVNVGNFFVGERDGGTGEVIQSGGDVTVTGQLRVGHWPQADVGNGTASRYVMNGGTITLTGDPADPFNEGQAGNVFLGIDSTGVLVINNGVFTAKGITLDNRGATGGEDTLEINGGTVNIGANGIVSQNATNPATYEVKLGGGTLRATASWASNLETNLISGGTGIQIDTNGNIVTLSGVVTGAGGFTKVGSGVLLLTGANTFAGGANINGGIVQVGNGGTTGSLGSGAVTIGAAGQLNYNRTDALTVAGAVSGSGSIVVNGGTLRLANASGTNAVTVATGATLGASGSLGAVNAAAGTTLEAGISGAGTLTSTALSLGGGTLKVSAGTTNSKFVVTGTNGLSVSGATNIQVNPVGLTPGTYTVVDYDGAIGGLGYGGFSLSGLPTRAVGGLVNNTGGTSVDLSITAIDFPKWTGLNGGDWDTPNNWQLVIGGGPTSYINLDAVLFNDDATLTTVNLPAVFTPTSVEINNPTKTYTFTGPGAISGTGGLVKQGAGRAIITNTGVNNYTGQTSVQGGVLQIGDGISGALSSGTNVLIGPAGTVELNLAAAYTTPTAGTGTLRTIGGVSFDLGANVLSGTPNLNLAGDSVQIISVGNQPAYDGNIVVSSGTLRALGTQALGTAVGTTTIAAGATLDVNAFDLGAEQVFVTGTGIGGNGAIVNNGGGTIFNLHKVTLTGNTTIGGLNRWDIRTSAIPGEQLDLAGFKLTKVGNNQVSVVESAITSGDIEINGGIFGIEGSTLAQGTGTITINAGNLGLYLNQAGRFTRPIVAAGGGILELGSGGVANVDAPVTLQANLNYQVNGGNTVVNQIGAMSEAGGARSLTVSGGGRLVLLGNNTWTGGFNVNGGSLQVGNDGTAGTLGSGPSTVAGTLIIAKSNPTLIDGTINAGGPQGQLFIRGGGAVSLSPGTNVAVTQLHIGINGQNSTNGGTLNIGTGNTLTVGEWFMLGNSDGGAPLTQATVNQTGGDVLVNSPGTDGRQFVLGHWGNTQGIYNLSGGTLVSPNISMAVSWDGAGTFNLSGGTANVKGVRFGHNVGQSGILNLTGGILALGSDGIWEQVAGLPNDINLGGGLVFASVNTGIFLPSELTGTNGNVNFDTNGNTLTIAGPLSGAGGFTKSGAGRLELNAANNAAGPFVVEGGTLSLVGAHTNNRIPNGGTVEIKTGGTVEFGSVNPTGFFATYVVDEGGFLTNAAGVEHVHVGTVQMNGGVWTTSATSGSYNGENYYLHTSVIVTGSAASTITQQGGTAGDRGIGWTGTVFFDVSNATADGASDLIVSTELEDSDSGAATLSKTGAGTMEIAFPTTYSGGTILDGGTLRVNNATGSGTGTGNVTVLSGTLAGAGTVGAGGAVTVTLSGSLAPGNSAGTLTFNLGTGTLDISGISAGALEFELGSTSDTVSITTGTLTIGAGTLEFNDFAFSLLGGFGVGDYVLFDSTAPIVGSLGANLTGPLGGGFTGTIQYGDGTNDLVLHVVPEPGSIMLALTGLGLLATRRRRVK